jgi:uncharacterized membrane protein
MPVVAGLVLVAVCLVLMGWVIGHYRRNKRAQRAER